MGVRNPDLPAAHHRRRKQPTWALAVLASAVVLAGCGGGGGGTLRSSLPDSLPDSVPSSLPSLPTVTRTTSTQVTTTQTETTPATSTRTVTTGPTESQPSDTPWGWIAAAAILVLILVLIGGWALGRRGASRRDWRAQVLQANGDGMALHDAALAEVIAATAANRPDRWSAIASAADELSITLHGLQTSAPDADGTRKTQAAIDAVGAVRSAVAIGGGAPPGQPLDQDVATTLRQRLEELAASLRDLKTYARGS